MTFKSLVQIFGCTLFSNCVDEQSYDQTNQIGENPLGDAYIYQGPEHSGHFHSVTSPPKSIPEIARAEFERLYGPMVMVGPGGDGSKSDPIDNQHLEAMGNDPWIGEGGLNEVGEGFKDGSNGSKFLANTGAQTISGVDIDEDTPEETWSHDMTKRNEFNLKAWRSPAEKRNRERWRKMFRVDNHLSPYKKPKIGRIMKWYPRNRRNSYLKVHRPHGTSRRLRRPSQIMIRKRDLISDFMDRLAGNSRYVHAYTHDASDPTKRTPNTQQDIQNAANKWKNSMKLEREARQQKRTTGLEYARPWLDNPEHFITWERIMNDPDIIEFMDGLWEYVNASEKVDE